MICNNYNWVMGNVQTRQGRQEKLKPDLKDQGCPLAQLLFLTEEVLISWTSKTSKFLTADSFEFEVQDFYPCCKAGLKDVKLKEKEKYILKY